MGTPAITRAPGPRSPLLDAVQYAPTWAEWDSASARAMEAIERGGIDETEYAVIEAAGYVRAGDLQHLYPTETARRSAEYGIAECRKVHEDRRHELRVDRRPSR